MRKSQALIVLVACFWLTCELLPAMLTQQLSGADSLSVGTTFTLSLQSDYKIKQVVVPDSLDSFAILSSKAMQDGNSWQLSIAPLKTGALSFPRLAVIPSLPATPPDSTDAFRIFVLSTLAEGDTLLRDIKPLQRYRLQLPWWLYTILFVVLIALLVYLIRSRTRKPTPTPPPVTPPTITPKPAWEPALQALNELLENNLLAQGDIVALHFGFSDILRSFLEATYRFPAMEMTVSEIAMHTRKRKINRSEEIQHFLGYCDMVKFAKVQPTVEEIDSRIQWLRSYLQSFVPKTAGDRQ